MSERDDSGVRFPPPLIYLGMLLAGMGVDSVFGLSGFGLPREARLIAGALLVVAGLAIVATAVRQFRGAGTSEKPWEPSTAIVDTGLYGRTRNPMYLAMALLYGGLALLFDSVAAMLLLPVVLLIIQTQVIAREERYLERKFGEPYRDYRRRVRRWL